jgi:hypothetical protein
VKHVIISGGARGADTLAERYAKEYSIPFELFKADWNKYGKAAGPTCNSEMIDRCDEVIAFWDLRSKGTKHMINTSLYLGRIVHVIPVAGRTS